MVDKAISDFPLATQANDTDEFEANQAGTSRKVTRAQLLATAAPIVHTHLQADITDAGALASLNSVGSAQIDADAVGESELAPPTEATRAEFQNPLPEVQETGTFTLSATAHFGRQVKLQNPTVASVVQLPDPNDAQFANLAVGVFCTLRVASGAQPASVTALVTDTFRHHNGYSSAISIGDEDTIFLGFSRASAFAAEYRVSRGTDAGGVTPAIWILDGPYRIIETDNLVLDLTVQDGGVQQLAHTQTLNFGANLSVSQNGRTVTVDAAAGGGSQLSTEDEGIVVETDTQIYNFVGGGVSVSSTGPNRVAVNIPGGAGGVSVFDDLGDTPASKTGAASQFVKVDGSETNLVYEAGQTIDDLPLEVSIDPANDRLAVWDASANDTVKATISDVVGTVGVSSWNTRTGAVVPVSGDYSANQVTFSPTGDIVATDVQAAIAELDTEKATLVHTHVVSQITDAGALASLDTVSQSEIDALAVGTPELINDAVSFAKMQNLNSDRLIGRTAAGVGDPAEIQISALTDQASPAGADSILAERASDGALVKIDVGNFPTSAVTSVFGRTGAVNATAGDYTATLVTNTPAGNIAAVNVQDALNELDNEKASLVHTHTLAQVTDSGALAPLDTVGTAEINDGAVTFIKQQNITSQRLIGRSSALTGLQEQIQISALPDQTSPALTDSILAERASDGALIKIDVTNLPSGGGGGAVDSVFGRTGTVIAVSGDYTAALITNVPAGSIAATDVQTAINELDGEKAPTVHTHTLADVTDSGALAALNTVDTAQIDNDAVTFAKMQTIATSTFVARSTAGTGDPEQVTAAQARTILNVEDGAAADQAAADVPFTPDGTIASNNVQAAVQEVRDEAPLISSENTLAGQMQIAVVSALPGTPDDNTIYFVRP